MAALVLAPTAAPARVACNWEHGGGSLTAHNVPRLLGINGGIAFFLLPWSLVRQGFLSLDLLNSLFPHNKPDVILARYGLDAAGITATANKLLNCFHRR